MNDEPHSTVTKSGKQTDSDHVWWKKEKWQINVNMYGSLTHHPIRLSTRNTHTGHDLRLKCCVQHVCFSRWTLFFRQSVSSSSPFPSPSRGKHASFGSTRTPCVLLNSTPYLLWLRILGWVEHALAYGTHVETFYLSVLFCFQRRWCFLLHLHVKHWEHAKLLEQDGVVCEAHKCIIWGVDAYATPVYESHNISFHRKRAGRRDDALCFHRIAVSLQTLPESTVHSSLSHLLPPAPCLLMSRRRDEKSSACTICETECKNCLTLYEESDGGRRASHIRSPKRKMRGEVSLYVNLNGSAKSELLFRAWCLEERTRVQNRESSSRSSSFIDFEFRTSLRSLVVYSYLFTPKSNFQI